MSTQRNAQKQQTKGSTPRLMIYASLFLAIAFVAAVLFGARILADRQTFTPVAMGPVDAPDARSAACTKILEEQPDDIGDFRSVDVLDPAPRGTMAFRDRSGTELTVRCGVTLPDQYTVLSPVSSSGDDARWFEVKDATPDSDLRTWYEVSGKPGLAVTSEADPDKVREALDDLAPTISGEIDESQAPKPKPVPLSNEPVAKDIDHKVCRKFSNALPEKIDDYQRQDNSKLAEKLESKQSGDKKLSDDLVVYQSKTAGNEPIVVRCGAKFPDAYKPGERITQVDEVPWFDAPALAKGSTSGRWYAVGHEEIVALAMPQSSGENMIPEVSKVIQDTMKKR